MQNTNLHASLNHPSKECLSVGPTRDGSRSLDPLTGQVGQLTRSKHAFDPSQWEHNAAFGQFTAVDVNVKYRTITKFIGSFLSLCFHLCLFSNTKSIKRWDHSIIPWIPAKALHCHLTFSLFLSWGLASNFMILRFLNHRLS